MTSGFERSNAILQIRASGVNFHVLRDSTGLYLIDAGFIGAWNSLLRGLRERGWERSG